jgi:hypothetical protein
MKGNVVAWQDKYGEATSRFATSTSVAPPHAGAQSFARVPKIVCGTCVGICAVQHSASGALWAPYLGRFLPKLGGASLASPFFSGVAGGDHHPPHNQGTPTAEDGTKFLEMMLV